MTDQFEIETWLPAAPEKLYDAWIDGAQHAAMTGGSATSDAEEGGRFTAWDGYNEGVHETLQRSGLVVQRWRTSHFPADAPESRLEVRFESRDGGTRLVLAHSEIPAGQGPDYEQGWEDHYFAPMKRWLAS